MSKIAEILWSLIPDDHSVTALTLIVIAVLMFHITWVGGLTPWNEGYAEASEVVKVRHTVESIQISLMDSKIFETKRLQCDAKGERRAYYTKRLTQLIREYKNLTGETYRVPNCDEI